MELKRIKPPYTKQWIFFLLIVPYGIETAVPSGLASGAYLSFNRTLWN